MTTPPPPQDTAFAIWQQESRVIDALQVVFVVGPPKCGTTWMMHAIGGHPHAVVNGESSVGRAFVPPLLAAFQHYNAHQEKYHKGASTLLCDRDFLMVLRQIIDRQLLQYLTDAGRQSDPAIRVVGDKTPAHAQHMDLLAQLYPSSRFIVCTRDVRDAAVSGWFHYHPQGWLEETSLEAYAPNFAAKTWAPMLRAARDSIARIGPDRVLQVSYETHHDAPKETMQDVFAFLGLSTDDGHVDAAVGASDFSQRSGGREPGEEDRGAFLRKGIVGDWREHLTETQGDEVVKIAHGALDGAPVGAV